MILAIDGPAGAGKSSVAKTVAERLNFHYLDTGAMYRATAWLALYRGISLDDIDALIFLAQHEPVTFANSGKNSQSNTICIAGHDVTNEIRTAEIDKAVTPVCKIAGVREALVEQQRAISKTENIVVEGRDIGTVVFPNAEVKVFLTASANARAKRRALQNKERGVGETDEKLILEDIIRRDREDANRDIAPMKPAKDAIKLDSTDYSFEEVCEIISNLVKEKM